MDLTPEEREIIEELLETKEYPDEFTFYAARAITNPLFAELCMEVQESVERLDRYLTSKGLV